MKLVLDVDVDRRVHEDEGKLNSTTKKKNNSISAYIAHIYLH